MSRPSVRLAKVRISTRDTEPTMSGAELGDTVGDGVADGIADDVGAGRVAGSVQPTPRANADARSARLLTPLRPSVAALRESARADVKARPPSPGVRHSPAMAAAGVPPKSEGSRRPG